MALLRRFSKYHNARISPIEDDRNRAVRTCSNKRLRVCEFGAGKLSDVQVLREAHQSSAVRRIEADTVVGKAPFHVLIEAWWYVETECT